MREPLVHFLLLAALVFAAYGLVTGQQSATGTIDVTQAKIEQLAGLFAKTWQRPPTAEELKGLIDDYVKEEVYVREALRMGLDANDAVIRKRLRLKMEFLNSAEAEASPPTEAQLQAYLDSHPDTFRQAPRVSFEQVYINPQKHEPDASAAAKALLGPLRKDANYAATAGDPTLLPAAMPLTDQRGIAEVFGDDFAAEVTNIVPGQWQGPITSDIGLHLVKVNERVPGSLPALKDIRPAVEREWMNDHRNVVEQQRFDDLLKRYKVIVEPLSADGSPSK
ncbi:peptidyl-prolyl cis-trans isomerase [Aestuariivirga litoralis]|uniref:peptidylprolyl isomerase n=1 Tax=Aestuariivirga litoralis TaxID=2650924 RepID=A0A2W2AUN1_9HYPH|nr:peptidyl-prolyl cis-trans isomerase [Aestuariivirga litoralis]